VTSRPIIFADGTTKTLGIIQPGDYEFGTEKKELMEILSGEVEVPGGAMFGIKIATVTDYRCILS
jgi:uncharacterized protein YaiE (UPF0345 family)